MDLEFIDNYFIVVYLVNARYVDPLYAHAYNFFKNQIVIHEGEQSYGKLPKVISYKTLPFFIYFGDV